MKILVVVDEEGIRNVIKTYLKSEDYEVVEASREIKSHLG